MIDIKAIRAAVDASAAAGHISCANPATVLALCDEVERLRNEAHNMNWALGTEGYQQMATPEEQAEYESAVVSIQSHIDRMMAAKDEHAAMQKDAARYRWLRKQNNEDWTFAVTKNCHFDLYESAEEIDAAIDTAMKPKT